MKALILAGGYATRLRPLSCQKPKLLFPVAGRPILDRTIETLKRTGVDEVILAVNYLADRLKAHFGVSYGGVKIRYSRESVPLGTAGPIKKAERILMGSDPFLAFNGDILFEGSLNEMLRIHKKRRATATIALKQVDDPSRFGVVLFDPEMRVERFVEKPPKEEAPSNYINAGVYVMSPRILGYIEAGRRCSTEREVFPALAEEGTLYAYIYKGPWFDIGKFEDYRVANSYYLQKASKDRPAIKRGATVREGSTLEPPVLVGRGALVEEGAHVGPFTVIGDGCVVRRSARIRDSILFDNVTIGEYSALEGCIIGDTVTVGDRVRIGRGTVIAEGVAVSSGVSIAEEARICPYKEINSDITDPRIVQ